MDAAAAGGGTPNNAAAAQQQQLQQQLQQQHHSQAHHPPHHHPAMRVIAVAPLRSSESESADSPTASTVPSPRVIATYAHGQLAQTEPEAASSSSSSSRIHAALMRGHAHETESVAPLAIVPQLVHLSPEARARQLIALALREAAAGTKPLAHVSVTGWFNSGGGPATRVVLYEVMVQTASNLRWVVARRYAEFAELNTVLEASVADAGTLPPFPSKEWRWWTDHSSPEFLATRQALLDNFLRKCLANPKLRSCTAFLDFVRPCREDSFDKEVAAAAAAVAHASQQASAHAHPHPHHGDSNSLTPVSAATSSLHDALFEPRSFDDEQKSERRERILSLSQQAIQSGADSPALSVVSEHSSDFPSRRQSRSQVYAPNDSSSPTSLFTPFTPAAAAAAAVAASPGSSSGSPHLAGSSLPDYVSSEVSDVSIPAAQVLKQEHVVFQVNVENVLKLGEHGRWTMLKRFYEFHELDGQVRAQIAQEISPVNPECGAALLARMPLLPRRELKLVTDHLHPRFVEKRRLLLQVYLQKLIRIPQIVAMECVLDFLGCN